MLHMQRRPHGGFESMTMLMPRLNRSCISYGILRDSVKNEPWVRFEAQYLALSNAAIDLRTTLPRHQGVSTVSPKPSAPSPGIFEVHTATVSP